MNRSLSHTGCGTAINRKVPTGLRASMLYAIGLYGAKAEIRKRADLKIGRMCALFRIASICLFISLSLFSFSSNAAAKRVNVYGWSDYVATSTLKDFEKNTGIAYFYDVYDSEDIMHAKLLSKATGYDVVFPANGPHLSTHIKLGLYLPLDKSKIPNYKNIDENILKILERDDPGNIYTVPWMMSATGIGYDINKIKEIDPNAPVDSLELIFNPEYAKKFEECGIFWFNFGQEMIGLALLYLGKDPNDTDPHNLALASETIKSVKKYVRSISSTAYVDFENSDMCITVGWTAEIAQNLEKLKLSRELSKKKFALTLPKEGFFVEIDNMAIPSNAKNIDNAHKFINHLLDPQVAAYNSNKCKHMNANKASYHILGKDITDNKSIHIPASVLQKNGKTLSAKSKEVVRTRNRTWAFIVSE